MSITAIIPAYNEEKNIWSVLGVLLDSHIFSSIIVIDDGSKDSTGERTRAKGVRVITQENRGKGAAMIRGAEAADTEYIFFCDADVVGLRGEHLHALVDPVVAGKAAMTIGLRDRGFFLTWLLPHIAPLLGGERALSRSLFFAIVRTYGKNTLSDFGVETYMNAYCFSHELFVIPMKMRGVTQVIKEKKYGFFAGFYARLRMIVQILHAEMQTIFPKKI